MQPDCNKKKPLTQAQKGGLTTSRYPGILEVEKGRVAGRRLRPHLNRSK